MGSGSGSRAGWCRACRGPMRCKKLIEKRAIDGLSIGFRTVRATREARGTERKLWAIDLWEISIVTFPMLAEARIAPGHAAGLDRLAAGGHFAVEAIEDQDDRS